MQAMKSQFNRFKRLRVLVVEGLIPTNFCTSRTTISQEVDHFQLPKVISKLIHLRYLSLRGSYFPCLLSSIGNLHHLEKLDLRVSGEVGICGIPNVLWKLKQLRYLYLSYYYDIFGSGKLINRFQNLQLDGLNKLEILESFSSPSCHIKDISKLKNLLALSANINVEFGDPTEIIRYMSDSSHLRRTSIGLFSKYSDTTNKKLSIAVGQCFSCRNLHTLRVYGPIGNLPKYEANFYQGLIELRLAMSMILEDPMKTLEMLPNLRSLELLGKSFVGKQMCCTTFGFHQLRNLDLSGLPNLEKWWVDDGAMPCLSSLTIDECKKLEMIPDGLRSITTLQELRIVCMPENS